MTAIYTSPLLRARQTAQIIAARFPGTVVRASDLLLETRTAFQGSPNSILKPGFSFYEPLHDPSDETMADIFGRMLRFLRRTARRHAGETVVAVSHADPITIMRVGLRGLPLTAQNLHREVYPDRASVTQVTLEPGALPHLTYFNPAEITRSLSA